MAYKVTNQRGVNGKPRGKSMLTKTCPAYNLGGYKEPEAIDHCSRCHYESLRISLETNEMDGWLITSYILWGAFCNQWLAIGWAIILGKE